MLDQYASPKTDTSDPRGDMLRQLMRFYECSYEAAKRLVLRHVHLGGVKNWMEEEGIRDDICARVGRTGHCTIVTALKKESRAIADFFISKFPEFQELLERIQTREISNGVEEKNRSDIKTALAHGLATFEDRLLRHLETFLTERGHRVDSLEFDGLKVWRNGDDGAFPRAILDEAEQYLAMQDIGGGTHSVFVPIKLEEKEMKSKYLINLP